ncbi:MAG: leucine--tRNA ligase [Chloroflexota bacterium]
MTTPPAPDRERPDRYDASEIEPRWQERWEELGLHRTDLEDTARPKYYLLTMFPYPSGDLHIGHWYVNTPTDARARFLRMNGFNVFFPIGFDAFGLPAENAAMKRGIHPREWTLGNIGNMRRQLRSMGATFAWDAEVVTCLPDYYRWNQWIFLRLLANDLAYRKMAAVDWCPKCLVVLAREQVEGVDRVCWRCATPVTKRDLEQWFFRTTRYADELLDHTGLDWPEPVRVMQTNWIGRSEGAEVVFRTAPMAHHAGGAELRVFTTRPDTLHGATFMVLAPEHPLVATLTAPERQADVAAYIAETKRTTEIDRLSTEREKTGVPIGADAINPVNGARIPIWIADYVLATYGTGAIMAVPAHDERDFAFARRFGLPIRRVIAGPADADDAPLPEAYVSKAADDRLVDSGPHTGLPAPDGFRAIVADLAAQGAGEAAVTYRLRDWLVSRQRAWGTPIPVVYCAATPGCGIVPVPEDQLPVRLPDDFVYRPEGGNPLETTESFLRTLCPRCGGPARRETDTMDTFVDSSWYWWRYLSPDRTDVAIDPDRERRWCAVDQYTGGAEHAVMHLLYARFFCKALADLGVVHEREPFTRLFNQGQILGADGERMSKSRGNVQDPDELVSRYGADAVRLFLMFMGPWDQGGPWSPTGIDGVHRFLRRVWTLVTDPHGREPGDPAAGRLPDGQDAATAGLALRRAAHRTLAAVTEDHEAFRWNTIVAKLMELTNHCMRLRGSEVAGTAAWSEATGLLVLMLAPLAPHIAEELHARRLAAAGETWRSVHAERWPVPDAALLVADTVDLPIQVNGKLRDLVAVRPGLPADELERIALAQPKIQANLTGMTVVKVIHVGGKLVNIVARPG